MTMPMTTTTRSPQDKLKKSSKHTSCSSATRTTTTTRTKTANRTTISSSNSHNSINNTTTTTTTTTRVSLGQRGTRGLGRLLQGRLPSVAQRGLVRATLSHRAQTRLGPFLHRVAVLGLSCGALRRAQSGQVGQALHGDGCRRDQAAEVCARRRRHGRHALQDRPAARQLQGDRTERRLCVHGLRGARQQLAHIYTLYFTYIFHIISVFFVISTYCFFFHLCAPRVARPSTRPSPFLPYTTRSVTSS